MRNILPRLLPRARKVGFLAIAVLLAGGRETVAQAPIPWDVHELDRPHPPIVTPARMERPASPPSDAIVLFDGTSLAEWESGNGGPARWEVEGGAMRVVEGGGAIRSRRAFGDVQLHIEWAAPDPASDSSRYRGNSGVHLMGLYEVQVLDSFQDRVEIYADGQAAAIYGQYPPDVNASRPPLEWQSFDIVFRRPRFAEDGRPLRPARMTVLHNGVLVHDNVELTGPTAHKRRPPYAAHAEKLPLMLQNHRSPVRFRNIWIRELPEAAR